MNSNGIQGDVAILDAAVTSCERLGRWDRLIELVGEIANAGVQPNARVYKAAVVACELVPGKWPRAVELLGEMEALGVPGDVMCFNSAIRACAVDAQHTHVLEVQCQISRAAPIKLEPLHSVAH